MMKKSKIGEVRLFIKVIKNLVIVKIKEILYNYVYYSSVEHRKREKEYKKRLAELKNEKPQELVTEEDIFKKLDALELQEELEDELIRYINLFNMF